MQSKARLTQWEVWDEVLQATKEWIEKANNANVSRTHFEMNDITIGAASSKTTEPFDEDPTW